MTGDGLFERGLELEELEAEIAAAAAGSGRLVVIEGPAGIGKTRLLAEAGDGRGGPMRVLSARGSELEREFPFGVVRQLFEAAVADPERAARRAGGRRGAPRPRSSRRGRRRGGRRRVVRRPARPVLARR